MNSLLGNALYTGPSQDKISTVIAGMSVMQLYEILSQMRTLFQQNPSAARAILVSNPQLTKALFQVRGHSEPARALPACRIPVRRCFMSQPQVPFLMAAACLPVAWPRLVTCCSHALPLHARRRRSF
jgi:hypothetical protein